MHDALPKPGWPAWVPTAWASAAFGKAGAAPLDAAPTAFPQGTPLVRRLRPEAYDGQPGVEVVVVAGTLAVDPFRRSGRCLHPRNELVEA